MDNFFRWKILTDKSPVVCQAALSWLEFSAHRLEFSKWLNEVVLSSMIIEKLFRTALRSLLIVSVAACTLPADKTEPVLVSASNLQAIVKCGGEMDKDWIQPYEESIPRDALFRYAVSLFGLPASCRTKKTSTSEGESFGQVTYLFSNGAAYSVETLPPETSETRLFAPHGFPNEKDAIQHLKKATTELGIAWSKPEISIDRGVTTKTFWNPDSGVNTRGFIDYKSGKLIAIGYGSAE